MVSKTTSVAKSFDFSSMPKFNKDSPSMSLRSSQKSLRHSFFEDAKFDQLSSNSGCSGTNSFNSKLTTNVEVGLCGLAGKPKLSMNESEGWIVDPRTPIKKFAALLFKLANVRQQIFKQLQREFVEETTIGSGSGGKVSSIAPMDFGSFVSEQTANLMQKASSRAARMSFGFNDSVVSCNLQEQNEIWYTDFVQPCMQRLTKEQNYNQVKLGPLEINKTERSGYTYFYLGSDDSRLYLPRFVTKYLLDKESTVKEMLRALRRESLMTIVNYQFGFKRLDKQKDD